MHLPMNSQTHLGSLLFAPRLQDLQVAFCCVVSPRTTSVNTFPQEDCLSEKSLHDSSLFVLRGCQSIGSSVAH